MKTNWILKFYKEYGDRGLVDLIYNVHLQGEKSTIKLANYRFDDDNKIIVNTLFYRWDVDVKDDYLDVVAEFNEDINDKTYIKYVYPDIYQFSYNANANMSKRLQQYLYRVYGVEYALDLLKYLTGIEINREDLV